MINVTPAVAEFATPYDANDVVGGVNTIYNLSGAGDEISLIAGVVVIDRAKLGVEMDIYFFDSLPTISADNAAWDSTGANAIKEIGRISVAAADFVDSASNSSAYKPAAIKCPSGDAGQTIYCVCVTRGAVDFSTYAAADPLVLRIAPVFKGE